MASRFLLLSLVFGSSLVAAQVPVVDTSGTRNQSTVQTAPANELMVTLSDQVTALQQEVQTLRGVVEELGYQVKRLQTEQRDRYLDIDRRLSALTPVSPQPTVPAPNQ